MPFGDGTGPNGMGPMTGRTAGYCAGYGVPGAYNRGFGGGRGMGWGRGRGFGMQPGYYGPVAPFQTAPGPDQEKQYLQQQVQFLEDQLAAMKKRIDELESGQKD